MDSRFRARACTRRVAPSEDLRIQISNSLILAVMPAKAGIHLIVVLFGRFVKEIMPLSRLMRRHGYPLSRV
ncbi:MAG: hypothetical protein HQL38_18655 [Alphaproteobacteria bacterium]|nr:hypothetical protein [Alphaproteobacteria bacterium]